MKYKAPTFLYSIIIPYSVVWQMCDNMTHKHIKILWRKCDYRKGTVTMRRLLLLWFLWYSCFAPKQERTFFFLYLKPNILVSWSLGHSPVVSLLCLWHYYTIILLTLCLFCCCCFLSALCVLLCDSHVFFRKRVTSGFLICTVAAPTEVAWDIELLGLEYRHETLLSVRVRE